MRQISANKCAALCAAVLGLTVSGAPAAQDDTDITPPDLASESGADAGTAPKSAAEDGQSRRIEAPVVRTRREHGQIITEYERRGGVYMMTVKPRSGPTQYWNDPDGDGQFQGSTSDDVDENMNLPKWRLGGW